ncbi:MAG: diaminopropionate ammonia-lyase [Candidatus Marinimicrobia bacterium]|nr:diaminopropionate ammonia-lyase [Candidatus Neomarinimicrobiota bacterium]
MEKLNIIKNQHFNLDKVKDLYSIQTWDPKKIASFHDSIGNKETPLVRLPGLAKHLGIGNILLKDESPRFGLNAFKALGASYAMHRQIKKFPQIKIFCTATDGNHGRAVAWVARKLNRKAVIYMPKWTVPARIKAIENEGAEVHVIDQSYDIAVEMANIRVEEGNKNGNNYWSLIQDTAWDGFEEIPLDIMKGYWTEMYEVTQQLKRETVDVLFLQSGVGSWAASILGYVATQWKNPPICISVEPYSANCLFESIKVGNRVIVQNNGTTIMAGLNCASVSTLAWDILKNGLSASMSIADELCEEAMRLLAYPIPDDPLIISGESGSSGLGGLIGLSRSTYYKELKEKFNLNKNSTVLVINTEGDTDPINYKKVINEKKY